MLKLVQIFDGWAGYHSSLVHAIENLSSEQLSWRPASQRRSVGELVRHISLGRITWVSRMAPLECEEVARRVQQWFTDGDGARHVVEEAVPCDDAALLSEWLRLSWQPILRVLNEWSVDDLFQNYPHRFRGIDYAVTRQWTLWRILSHDTHHGGQLAMMLALQGVDAFELRALGGHIVSPALAKSGR